MATKRKPRRVWQCRLSLHEIQALNRAARAAGVSPGELVRSWIVRESVEADARAVAAELEARKAGVS